MTERLKTMVLNAQDLFLFMDKHHHTSIDEMNEIKWQLMSSSLLSNKSKEKCQLLAKVILDHDIDIVMVTEVGGLESLTNFSKILLNDQYEALSLPSNSDRGIDLGYLVKRKLNFKLNLKGHIDYKLKAPSYKFSRDVLRLDVSDDKNLKLIFLLVHIKSKLNLRNNDFEGRTRRVHEIEGLIDIYKDLEKLNVPILIGGDFNGIASETGTEEEFKAIYEQTDLIDVALVAKIPIEERFSYVYFNRGGNRFLQQIDYLFISKKYQDLVINEETFFPRYSNLQGLPLPIPVRIEQKGQLPSDHYPFVTMISLKKS